MSSFSPIHPGRCVENADVTRVLKGLREQTLPKEEWTHGAHLCAGVGLLKEVGLTVAEEEMPGLIRRYNVATGCENTENAGYHHTLTLFYLRVIYKKFESRWSDPVATLASDLLLCDISDKKCPLGFYSSERLFSVKARKMWVEPDLRSL